MQTFKFTLIVFFLLSFGLSDGKGFRLFTYLSNSIYCTFAQQIKTIYYENDRIIYMHNNAVPNCMCKYAGRLYFR